MIYPKPSLFCGKCMFDKKCDCICHDKDVINSKHYEIHEDDQKYTVKAVVDLDHFRD